MVTSKKDKKKNISFTKMPETNKVSVNTYLWGTKSDNQQLQALTYINLQKKTCLIIRSDTIFTRKKEMKDVKLEDFNRIKVIAKGNLGKVFTKFFTQVFLVEYITFQLLLLQQEEDRYVLS